MEAAVREVGEETGIEDLNFDWGDRFVDTDPYNRGKVARYYLARTVAESVEMGLSPELGRPEHHEYRWVNFDEAYDLSSPRVQADRPVGKAGHRHMTTRPGFFSRRSEMLVH